MGRFRAATTMFRLKIAFAKASSPRGLSVFQIQFSKNDARQIRPERDRVPSLLLKRRLFGKRPGFAAE